MLPSLAIPCLQDLYTTALPIYIFSYGAELILCGVFEMLELSICWFQLLFFFVLDEPVR